MVTIALALALFFTTSAVMSGIIVLIMELMILLWCGVQMVAIAPKAAVRFAGALGDRSADGKYEPGSDTTRECTTFVMYGGLNTMYVLFAFLLFCFH